MADCPRDGNTLARTETRTDGRKTPRRPAECVVVIHWNAQNRVSKLHISFAPMGAALSFSTRLAEKLEATA